MVLSLVISKKKKEGKQKKLSFGIFQVGRSTDGRRALKGAHVSI